VVAARGNAVGADRVEQVRSSSVGVLGNGDVAAVTIAQPASLGGVPRDD